MFVDYLVMIDGSSMIDASEKWAGVVDNLGYGSPSECRWMVPNTVSVDGDEGTPGTVSVDD